MFCLIYFLLNRTHFYEACIFGVYTSLILKMKLKDVFILYIYKSISV